MAPFLITLVFGALDLSRAWSLQSRLSGAAREGAAAAQHCAAPGEVEERVRGEDETLPAQPGFAVTVEHVDAAGTRTAYTGCGTATFLAGDRVVVRAGADLDLLTPVGAVLVGRDPVHVSRAVDVAVLR